MITMKQLCSFLNVLPFIFILFLPRSQGKGGTPDLSSTVLKLHKLYLGQPPHDPSLYKTLQVSPNATAAEITKSYHRLSRKYQEVAKSQGNQHQQQQQHHHHHQQQQQQQLQKVQQAYDILKDDVTRLPYHKYGLTDPDPNVAIVLLLGPTTRFSKHVSLSSSSSSSSSSYLHGHNNQAQQQSLLQFMGIESNVFEDDPSIDTSHPQIMHQLRVKTIAARLVEQIRPVVEGSMDPQILIHSLAKECDTVKGLPMGANIIRCVGRAYRHAGKDYLIQHYHQHEGNDDDDDSKSIWNTAGLSVAMRQHWRHAKDLMTAAMATGKASMSERVWTWQEQRRRRRKQSQSQQQQSSSSSSQPFIEYEYDYPNTFLDDDSDDLIISDLDDDDHPLDFLEPEEEEEMEQSYQLKAKQTLLQSMQVEAWWKITKIDLDKIVREACNLILNGDYFFFPSHQKTTTTTTNHLYGTGNGQEEEEEEDGWISSTTGKTIYAQDAKILAAQVMERMGNVMVQRSKQDTAWKD